MKNFILLSAAVLCIGAFAAAQTNAASAAFKVEEQNFQRKGMKISGELFISDRASPVLLVSLSHGFGGNRGGVKGYAESFAEQGIAAYIFEFIGGGDHIKSDGKMTEMSEGRKFSLMYCLFRSESKYDLQIDMITDLFTQKENEIVTCGKSLHISGNRIRILGTLEDCGIYFVPKDGSDLIKVKTAHIFTNSPSLVEFFVPAELEKDKEYAIRICTHFSSGQVTVKELRTTETDFYLKAV